MAMLFLVRGPCDGKQLALASLPMSTMAQNSMLASSNTLFYRQDDRTTQGHAQAYCPLLRDLF